MHLFHPALQKMYNQILEVFWKIHSYCVLFTLKKKQNKSRSSHEGEDSCKGRNC